MHNFRGNLFKDDICSRQSQEISISYSNDLTISNNFNSTYSVLLMALIMD